MEFPLVMEFLPEVSPHPHAPIPSCSSVETRHITRFMPLSPDLHPPPRLPEINTARAIQQSSIRMRLPRFMWGNIVHVWICHEAASACDFRALFAADQRCRRVGG